MAFFYTGDTNDDAWQRGTSAITVGDNKTYVYSNTSATSSSYICTGARFPNITISQGATITTAYIRCMANYMSEVNANFTLYAEDVDNAVNFVSNADVISRVRTTANVSFVYNSLSMDWFGSDKEIKTIIQEIVDRGNWVSGNAICMLLIGNTDSNKKVRISTGQGAGQEGLQLYIEYTGAVATGNTIDTITGISSITL